jgi:hypothetical protein
MGAALWAWFMGTCRAFAVAFLCLYFSFFRGKATNIVLNLSWPVWDSKMPQSIVNLQTDRRSLYSRCEDRERKLLRWETAAFKNQVISGLVFGIPLFLSSDAVPTLGRRTSEEKKPSLGSSAYLGLVQTLKKAKNNDELWFLLALWLKQEAIREPEDFLPTPTYARLTLKARERLREISFTDMRYFELVRCWEPYFVQLLADRKRLRHNSASLEKELSALGYVPKSVELVMRKGWRSAIELACEWLADREVIPPKKNDQDPVSALRNAYSRIKAGASASPTVRQTKDKVSSASPSAKKAK